MESSFSLLQDCFVNLPAFYLEVVDSKLPKSPKVVPLIFVIKNLKHTLALLLSNSHGHNKQIRNIEYSYVYNMHGNHPE